MRGPATTVDEAVARLREYATRKAYRLRTYKYKTRLQRESAEAHLEGICTAIELLIDGNYYTEKTDAIERSRTVTR